jgi:hypothetical protein
MPFDWLGTILTHASTPFNVHSLPDSEQSGRKGCTPTRKYTASLRATQALHFWPHLVKFGERLKRLDGLGALRASEKRRCGCSRSGGVVFAA